MKKSVIPLVIFCSEVCGIMFCATRTTPLKMATYNGYNMSQYSISNWRITVLMNRKKYCNFTGFWHWFITFHCLLWTLSIINCSKQHVSENTSDPILRWKGVGDGSVWNGCSSSLYNELTKRAHWDHFMFMVPCITDKIYLIIVQQDATQSSLFIILQVHSIFSTPIISSTQNCNYSLQYCSYLPLSWPRYRKVAAQKIWPVLEAVVTVLCTTDDGCD